MKDPDLLGDAQEPRRAMGSHQSAAAQTESWLTPPEVLTALGHFDLDPCAPLNRPWDTADKHYTVVDNGLVQPWEGRAYVNPPYGDKTGKWLARLAAHGNGIALIFARTETADWFNHIWPHASAILFLKGRLTFYTNEGRRSATVSVASSALIAYGADNARCLRECGLHGAYVDLTGVHLT